jgi:hypothetical protein
VFQKSASGIKIFISTACGLFLSLDNNYIILLDLNVGEVC